MSSVSEDLDENVEKLLNGGGLEVTELPEQMQAVTLRKSVCYIVSAVIFNEKGEVLMVQEAKRECYGRWYLPAGRMEVGESIHEALRREVKEEAGLECEPVTMLLVQEQGQRWIRFCFLAQITGGSLKSTADADSESLQAQWWDRETPLPLRSRDISPLINAGLRYQQRPWFPVCHPVALPSSVVCLRLLLIFTSDDQSLWLLLTDHQAAGGTRFSFPLIVTENMCMVTGAMHRLLQESLPSLSHCVHMNTHGILGVQHDGRVHGQTDGVCFNMMVTLELSKEGAGLSNPPVLENERYIWQKLANQSLEMRILSRIKEGSVMPMYSL